MQAVLFRTLVSEFFRQNTGFFLIVLMLGFGIIRPDEHIALFQYALLSPSMLLYYFVIWSLYGLKTIGFIRSQLRHPAYEFLWHFRLVSPLKRWFGWIMISLSLLLPVVLYAGWMSFYAIKHAQYAAIAYLIAFFVALLMLATFVVEYTLRTPDTEVRIRTFARNWALPYPLFFIRYLFRRSPILLILTKVFSGLLLIGVCLLYPTDEYDERLLGIGLLLGGLAHLGMAVEQYTFEHQYLLFVRNLPFSAAQRLVQILIQQGLIFVPEMILLFRYLPESVSFWFVGKGLIFSTGIAVAGLHRLVQNDRSLEKLTSYGLYGFISGLLLLMFRIDLAIIGLVLWGYAVWVNTRQYHQSEFLFEKSKSK